MGIVWVQTETHSQPAHPFLLLTGLDSLVLYPDLLNLSSIALFQHFAIIIMPFMLLKHI